MLPLPLFSVTTATKTASIWCWHTVSLEQANSDKQKHIHDYIGLFGACDNATQKQRTLQVHSWAHWTVGRLWASQCLPYYLTQQDRKKKASLKTTEETHASTGLQTHDETGKSWHMISTVCILQTPISKNVLNIFRNQSVARVYSKFSIIER